MQENFFIFNFYLLTQTILFRKRGDDFFNAKQVSLLRFWG